MAQVSAEGVAQVGQVARVALLRRDQLMAQSLHPNLLPTSLGTLHAAPPHSAPATAPVASSPPLTLLASSLMQFNDP